MRNSLILCDIERELLIIRGVKEGFVDFGLKRESNDEKYLDLLKQSGISSRRANKTLRNLYQNILLYDEIISPSVQTYSFKTDKLNDTGFFKLGVSDTRGVSDTSYLFGTGRLPDIDCDYAQYIKPIIIESILKVFRNEKGNTSNYKKLICETNNTLRQYLSIAYDDLYSKPLLTRMSYLQYLGLITKNDESILENPYVELDCFIADFIAYFSHNLIFDLETSALENAVISGNDFDLHCFSKFGIIEENVSNQCYELLKIDLKNEIYMLPSFNGLNEVLLFKKRNKQGIKRLRSVLDELEYLFRNGMSIQAVSKARVDINKAVRELSKYDSLEKTSKWITLLSLPIGIAELYLHSSFIGLGITALSFTNQISMDMCKKRNNWIYLIR